MVSLFKLVGHDNKVRPKLRRNIRDVFEIHRRDGDVQRIKVLIEYGYEDLDAITAIATNVKGKDLRDLLSL